MELGNAWKKKIKKRKKKPQKEEGRGVVNLVG